MRYPIRFALVYLCVSAGYVMLTHQYLPRLFADSFFLWDTYLDGGYILSSTLLIYLVLEHERSRRDALEAKLEDDAVHDPLTHLTNRRAFIGILESAIHRAGRNQSRLGLAFIDLDGFKQVNDIYGHNAGDQLLIAVSERLQEVVRKGDLVARMGGDEFVVLIEPDKNEGSEVLAKRLIEAFQQPFRLAGHSLHVTLSIGVAFAPEHASEAEWLLRAADMAMYRVKKTGRNGYALAEASDVLADVAG
jgi:diguanylate cyclase (GGDEF)-like protein